MWRNKFRQGFSSSGRRQIGTWHRYYKLGSFSFLGVVMMVAIFIHKKAIAFPTLSSDWQDNQRRSSTKPTTLKSPVFRQKVLLSTQHSAIRTIPSSTTKDLIADLPNILPPANLPMNPGGVVKVPPLNRPEGSVPIQQQPTMPSVTLPPPVFQRDRIPTFSVPAVQSIPGNTSQSSDRQLENTFPTLSSPPVIEFGQPLPKARGGRVKLS